LSHVNTRCFWGGKMESELYLYMNNEK